MGRLPAAGALACLLTLAAPVVLAGAAFKGTVVHVADGDTITILLNGREEKGRLVKIDCPERGQAFGRRAHEATVALEGGDRRHRGQTPLRPQLG